jgi:peptidoglycan/LPS O-acetylase OafA/YrhL
VALEAEASQERTEGAARDYAAQRDPALDGVRGLAMLMVVLIHGFTPRPDGLLSRVLHNGFESFFIAVDLFFVLSGFLITTILIRSRGSEVYLRQFYWRRILRIAPAYIMAMLVCFVVLPHFTDPDGARALHAATWPHLLYLQNLFAAVRGPMPSELSHFWSLAIEEQFYLLWPLTVLAVPQRWLARVCGGLYGLACLAKLGFWLSGASWLTLYVCTPCHMEGLVAGAWIAASRENQGRWEMPGWLRRLGPMALAALLALAVCLPGKKLFDRDQVALHTFLASVVFTWMMYHVIAAGPGDLLRRVFSLRFLRVLGTYSYGIYLMGWGLVLHVQYPLAAHLLHHMGDNLALVLSGLFTAALNIGLAVLMYHGIEKPVLAWKDRGPGRRRPVAAVIPGLVPPPDAHA